MTYIIPNFTCLIRFGRLSTTCSFIPSLVAVDSMVGVASSRIKVGCASKIFDRVSGSYNMKAGERGEGRGGGRGELIPAPGR